MRLRGLPKGSRPAGFEVPCGSAVLVDDVAESFAAFVCSDMAAKLAEAGPAKGRYRAALSGGSTAKSCYEALSRAGGASGVDWGTLELLVGDERCVPPDDAEANQAMIRAVLLGALDPAPTLYPMDCAAPVAAYEAVVRPRLPLDLVHLGCGPDGHTASLFPGSKALDARAGSLVARNVDPSGHNPYERLTLTFEAISQSRVVLITVAGPEKSGALARVVAGDDVPISRVRAPEVIWLCDRAVVAGAGLP